MRRIIARAPQRVSSSLTTTKLAQRTARSVAVRCISTTTPMASSSHTASSVASATHPADAFQLLSESQKPGEAEDALYEAQIKEVEAWWSSSRYTGIQRPYSAADVVSKRGSQTISYPSSVMARKLFNLIQERSSKGEPIHTSKPSLFTSRENPVC